MANETYDWSKMKADIAALLQKTGSRLPAESLSGVQHYLDHDEYEMAFEGLFIDIMEAGVPVAYLGVSKEHLLFMGRAMGLDSETVFLSTFWEKFTVYLGSASK